MSIFPAFFLAQGLMFLGLFILIPAKRNLLFQKSRDTDGSSCGFVHLFTKRPCFLFLLVSILLVYISYTAINNFHINIIESVGGGSPELGVSTSLAAMLELPAMALFVPVSKKVSYRHLLSISCVFFFLKAFLMLFFQKHLRHISFPMPAVFLLWPIRPRLRLFYQFRPAHSG